MISPVTKYGQSYDTYDFSEDNNLPEYWDLEATDVIFSKEKYSVDVYIDHSHGYAGFQSMLGKNVFGGPNKWDGYEIVVHSGSEHTIDGKRYDFEL